MLLANKADTFSVPHTSKCEIHTQGVINDGDVISISSPIFSSTNFLSNEITMSDHFEVVVRLRDPSHPINHNTDETLFGVLVCDDNDIFNMYVRL